jgi:carnitine-CoA ligase
MNIGWSVRTVPIPAQRLSPAERCHARAGCGSPSGPDPLSKFPISTGVTVLAHEESYHDLVTLVRAKARKNSDRAALRFNEGSLSYRELDRLSDRVAAGLSQAGIEPGDRVASLVSNRPEFPILWFGLSKLGALLVPLNTALRGELLEYEISDSGAKGIVVEGGALEAFQRVRSELSALSLWTVGESTLGTSVDGTPFSSLLHNRDPPPAHTPEPWDPAEIIYTSGTTDRPKGVVLPHERLVNTPREVGLRAHLREDSVLFTALPLFHCNAQEKTALVAILNDLTATFDERFHASTFWEHAGQFGATHVALLTSMISILFKQEPKPTDRAHGVQYATASGTPAGIWKAFEERFGITLVESYGMTECGCTTIMNPPQAPRLGSVGTPLGFVEAQLVDDFDRPVPTGSPGELIVRPRQPFTMFLEYYGKPQKTLESWRNLWFHTGDLLKADADGYFYFLDRKKDIIRRRGENIAPYDVEVVLNQHPHVFDTIVVAVPAEVGEEDVKAVVQLKAGASVSAEELFAFAEARLPTFMVPRYIEFVEEIPRTVNQKAQRYLLRGKLSGREIDRTRLSPPGP